MSTEIKIALIVVCILTILLSYSRYTRKKYGRLPISKIGIVLETVCVAIFVFFYFQYSQGQADKQMLVLGSIALLAVSVVISVFLCILNCKKIGMKIGEIILGAFVQIVGFFLLIPAILKIIMPALKSKGGKSTDGHQIL